MLPYWSADLQLKNKRRSTPSVPDFHLLRSLIIEPGGSWLPTSIGCKASLALSAAVHVSAILESTTRKEVAVRALHRQVQHLTSAACRPFIAQARDGTGLVAPASLVSTA